MFWSPFTFGCKANSRVEQLANDTTASVSVTVTSLALRIVLAVLVN